MCPESYGVFRGSSLSRPQIFDITTDRLIAYEPLVHQIHKRATKRFRGFCTALVVTQFDQPSQIGLPCYSSSINITCGVFPLVFRYNQ